MIGQHPQLCAIQIVRDLCSNEDAHNAHDLEGAPEGDAGEEA